MYVRRVLPLLVAAGISLGVAACGSDSGSGSGSGDDEVQRRQRQVQRRRARRGQEGRSSHRAGRGRRGLRRPGPDLLRLRLHDPLRGQPRRCTPTGRATSRSRGPDIADGEPQISSDQKTITVKLKKGIKFAPPVNREITSKDIKYGFERAFSSHVPSPYATVYFKDIVGAPTKPAEIKDIPGIETPDDSTIVFKLKTPSAALVSQALAMPISTPVPQEYAKQVRRQDAVDLRPVRRLHRSVHVQERQLGQARRAQAGRSIELVRNPNWDAEDRLPPRLPGLDHDRGGQRRRGLLGAADPQGLGARPGRRHDARAGHQAGARRATRTRSPSSPAAATA